MGRVPVARVWATLLDEGLRVLRRVVGLAGSATLSAADPPKPC
jgi:hypothetical protein